MTFTDAFYDWYIRNFEHRWTVDFGKFVKMIISALDAIGLDRLTTPGGIKLTEEIFDWLDEKISAENFGVIEIWWPKGWDYVLFENETHCANVDGEYKLIRDLLGGDLLFLVVLGKLGKWIVKNKEQAVNIVKKLFGVAMSFWTMLKNRAKHAQLVNAGLTAIDLNTETQELIESEANELRSQIGLKLRF